MTGPSRVETLRESCTYRASLVRCPTRQLPASVVAAKWRLTNGEWTPWEIVDCPLLPAGVMDCDMQCLSQLEVGTA